MNTKLNKDGTPRKIRIKKLDSDKGSISNEELKQFWNHNINPITGFKITTSKREIYLYTNFWLDKTRD